MSDEQKGKRSIVLTLSEDEVRGVLGALTVGVSLFAAPAALDAVMNADKKLRSTILTVMATTAGYETAQEVVRDAKDETAQDERSSQFADVWVKNRALALKLADWLEAGEPKSDAPQRH